MPSSDRQSVVEAAAAQADGASPAAVRAYFRAVPTEELQHRGVAELAELIAGRRWVALTGAGMSTGSGLPDYRGPQAVPRSPRPVLASCTRARAAATAASSPADVRTADRATPRWCSSRSRTASSSAAAWARAASRSVVTTTPLPAASPSSLTTQVGPKR